MSAAPPSTTAAPAAMDPFAVLGEPRRPWLDAEALRSQFLEASTGMHPDRFHDAPEPERTAAERRYADLNAAYQALREPRSRLLHLLLLETGSRPPDIQRIPPGTLDLFVEVGRPVGGPTVFWWNADRWSLRS